MVKKLRPGTTWVPGEITKQLGPVTFEIRVGNGQTWKRHVDHIKTLGDKDILKEVSKEQEPEDCGDFLEILPTSSATPESAAMPSNEEPPTTASVPRHIPQENVAFQTGFQSRLVMDRMYSEGGV